MMSMIIFTSSQILSNFVVGGRP